MRRLPAAVATAAALLWAAGALGQGLPNLTPFQPSGWSDKIVVSRTIGGKTDSSSLAPTDTLYVAWAVINNGSTPTGVRFFTEMYVDGVLKDTRFTDPPLNPGFYAYIENYSIGSLPAGTHTIRIKTDSTGVISETIETDNEYTKTITVGPVCAASATELCLNSSRFKVRVSWRVPSQGTSGAGNAVPLTSDTGYFWFFTASNVELVIKVVDGRSFNGKFWVFYGALSDVEYTIAVTDTQTGAVKTYFNPSGRLGSVADTDAFAGSLAAPTAESRVQSPESKVENLPPERTLVGRDPDLGPWTLDLGHARANAACAANSTTLCLNAGRFQVRVTWRVPAQGTSGSGTAVALTSDTGYFWFFSANNIELVLKVVDGRAFNNAFWVFYGALSNVEYTITVTDTQTGSVKTYVNPSGQLGSVADTSAFAPSPYSVPIENLKQPDVQARMNKENFPAMIRGGAEIYNPEIVQLIAAGSSAVPRILDEFRRPTSLLDDTPLSLLAYALEKIGDPSAVPVLTDWLEANLFAELQWATDFVTHTIKVLNKQGGLNTSTYIYTAAQKVDTIVLARAGRSNAPLLAGTCSATAADPFGTCPQTIVVTGINSAGQQETVELEYRVPKRDMQDVINSETDPAVKNRLISRQQGWASTDEQNYGGTNYEPLPGAAVSVKSNCAGTVIEHIINTISAQKGFGITLPQGGSTAEQIRNLALKFGGSVELSAIDTMTVVSHESTEADGSITPRHVEVPISADASSAVIYSKDNYGILRQHTTSKSSFSFNSFKAAQQAYGNRPWYQLGASPITTRFYRVDPNRILGISVRSSACPCNPTAPDAIPVAITSPSGTTTDQRVVTVAGTVGASDVTSATLTVNNSPQTVAVSGGGFSSQVVLSSGDNTIKVDVTGPTGRRGCATKTIKSTTVKTTISVTLTWNLDNADVDLYVTQPDGETSWFQNRTTTIGGRLDVDNTQGFGPENYFLSSANGNKVLPGTYKIRVHYYSDHQRDDKTPTRVVTWRVVVLVNEGTPNEKREIFSGSLSKDDNSNYSTGSIGPDWALVENLNFQPP
jgi:uncharacterized protein YfaP (DUF2135 family)